MSSPKRLHPEAVFHLVWPDSAPMMDPRVAAFLSFVSRSLPCPALCLSSAWLMRVSLAPERFTFSPSAGRMGCGLRSIFFFLFPVRNHLSRRFPSPALPLPDFCHCCRPVRINEGVTLARGMKLILGKIFSLIPDVVISSLRCPTAVFFAVPSKTSLDRPTSLPFFFFIL